MTGKRQAAGLGGPPAARVCAVGELPATGTDAYLAAEAAGVGADDQVSASRVAPMRRLLCNIHGPQEFAALGLVNAGFGALTEARVRSVTAVGHGLNSCDSCYLCRLFGALGTHSTGLILV